MGEVLGIPVFKLLQVFAVPVTLGVAVPWLNWLQKKRELSVENQRAQDDALQAYLDRMAQLLTKRESSLRSAQPGEDLSVAAWAWTKTVLRMMGPERKGHVLRFVNEAGLINKDRPVFFLYGANLREADLRGSVLRGVSRGDDPPPGVNLSKANLSEANLSEANLSEANLSGADLTMGILYKANLRGAGGWTDEQLRAAQSLEGATMPDGQTLRGDKNPNGPTFEDWLKDIEGRKEDTENVGPS